MPGQNRGYWKEGKFMAKKRGTAVETIPKLPRVNKQCKW